MKFRLAFEGSEKKLTLIPESGEEGILLGSLFAGINQMEKNTVRDVQMSPILSDDRAPYKKCLGVEISL